MYLGKVIFSEEYSSSNKNLKVKLGKKTFIVKTAASDEESTALLDSLYVYAANCYDENEEKAYKILEKNEDSNGFYSKTLYIVRSQDSNDIYDMSIEESRESATHALELESFFGGEYRLEIKEDAAELLREYDPNIGKRLRRLLILSLIIFVILLGGYFYSTNIEESEALEFKKIQSMMHQKESKHVVLGDGEISRLKREISKELLEDLLHKTLEIKNKATLNNHASIRTLNVSYSIKDEKVLLNGNIEYEFNYPAEKTNAKGEGTYSKIVGINIEKSSVESKKLPEADLSVECVKMAMRIETGDAVVIERGADSLKIKYTQMRPSILLGQMTSIIDQCPVYIDAINIVDERFDLTVVLYSEKNKQ